MKRTFRTIDERDRHLYYSRALATHFTPDGLPCRYLIYGESWQLMTGLIKNSTQPSRERRSESRPSP